MRKLSGGSVSVLNAKRGRPRNIRGDFYQVLGQFVKKYGLNTRQVTNLHLEGYIFAAMKAGYTESQTVNTVRRNARFYFAP